MTIADPAKQDISDELLSKWQNIINIIADLTGVSAGLIMKITPDSMEVFLKSQNKNNPYKAGDSETLGHGLYCETVISQNKELFIKKALEHEAWQDNPDIDLNMISYYGLPLNWPDGESFGTICILDNESMDLDQSSKKLMKKFKNVIEDDLDFLSKKTGVKNKKQGD
ncbi:GAF domain-containing protein [Halarsenatibacter silvermanii]|uniref:GAF domain-containing protein n=1 Tax=Halarsenatibacter silvermanii TaxID=321763 RepID=A0A1G9K4V6_9FIRM|nr:GAF domain-containing protein [Halarsenatibacter silvermanii]SDL44293.1 hypothetical protein SAMN04488692_104163 [Halarsenatibacter silvermanii]